MDWRWLFGGACILAAVWISYRLGKAAHRGDRR